MASSQINASVVPQGFSVYQSAPGAQLQFFPAVGTQQLDDLIHAYIPGPASIQEKRATVSIDFLKYTQTTGETFNFYPVMNVVESPVATDSLSSYNASPMTPTWDWGHISNGPVSSSGSSVQGRQSRKPSAASPRNGADLSNLPGMKIMTRDGRDVTDSASRGSKTKEQRDHAHLMRIIKACDSCRRKKIRCDPSHKKRGASQAQATTPVKVAKKTKVSRQQDTPAPPAIFGEDASFSQPAQLEVDWSSAFLEDFPMPDMPDMPLEAWDELLAQPQLMDVNNDFLIDQFLLEELTEFASTQSSASPGTSSAPLSSRAQTSLNTPASASPGAPQPSPQLPYDVEQGGSSVDYTDFNLYSPESSFSEDERMVSIRQPSINSLPSAGQSQSPDRESPGAPTNDPGVMEWVDWGTGTVASTYATSSDVAAGDERVDYNDDPDDDFSSFSFVEESSRGVANSDLIEANESAVSSMGYYDVQNTNHRPAWSGDTSVIPTDNATRSTQPSPTLAQQAIIEPVTRSGSDTQTLRASATENVPRPSSSARLQTSEATDQTIHSPTSSSGLASASSESEICSPIVTPARLRSTVDDQSTSTTSLAASLPNNERLHELVHERVDYRTPLLSVAEATTVESTEATYGAELASPETVILTVMGLAWIIGGPRILPALVAMLFAIGIGIVPDKFWAPLRHILDQEGPHGASDKPIGRPQSSHDATSTDPSFRMPRIASKNKSIGFCSEIASSDDARSHQEVTICCTPNRKAALAACGSTPSEETTVMQTTHTRYDRLSGSSKQ